MVVAGTSYSSHYSIKNTDSGQSAVGSAVGHVAIEGRGSSQVKFIYDGYDDTSSVTVTLKLYKGAPPQDTNPLQTRTITFGY